MERIDALEPGVGMLADYPFVRRLRNRRLIVYLYLQGFESAYDRIVHETDLYMSRRRLKQLVACGQWTKALGYIRRFVPPAIGGVEARTLYIFLDTFWAVENAAAACSAGAPVATAVYKHDVGILTTMCAGNTKLSSILHKIHHSPQFRASLDWKMVREKASLVADDLVNHSPELRRRSLLPNGPRSPHDLLPIGPRRPRRQRRETSWRPTTSAIVKSYLNRKRSLPSSSPVFGLNSEGRNRVVDLIEDCIKDGRLPELHQGHLLQSSAMEGPAKNIETSSVINAGNPTCTGLPNYLCWYPPVANSGIQVSRPAETSGFTSATNAGVAD
ncbi:uncharacterized protein LOC123427719 isoform X2 [Hordeum vulgare subsp. vulgare]|uniref:uncharacterized protein LOC123427719 isoform X2 n=1 Tax=Hordeum vulgare subsp. vulgare TaxID=112509 RepID=UPI0002948240|nr:uncharacterized protein LOC123427719 isoform X2 [Hordeum vulgare subsp. vulgare]